MFVVSCHSSQGPQTEFWDKAVALAKGFASKDASCMCAIWADNLIVGLVSDDANGLTVRDFRTEQK